MVGILDGNKPGISCVGIIDEGRVGMIEGAVVFPTSVGNPDGDGGGIMDGIPLGRNVVGCHVGGIVGTAGGTVVGEGNCMEGGLPAGVGPVGSAVGVWVGIPDGTKFGSSAVGRSAGGGVVATTGGMLPWGVVNDRAVGGGDGSMDGVVLGKSIVGNSKGLSVAINVSIPDGEGPAMKGGDIFGKGVDGEIDGDGVGNVGGNTPDSSGVGIDDGDSVGMMEGIIVGRATPGVPVGSGEVFHGANVGGEMVIWVGSMVTGSRVSFHLAKEQ